MSEARDIPYERAEGLASVQPAAGHSDASATAQPAPAQPADMQPSPAPVAPERRGPKVSTVIAIVILVAGVGVVAYPSVSDWWNTYHQTRVVSGYVTAVQETDSATIEQMLADAHDYNERLKSKPNRFVMSDEEKAEYMSLLNLTGDGIMGYVEVSSINVLYPIYHGMDEAVLQVAIGHLEGTSLPVGGESTHAVISGHRGLPSAKLFTDISKLVEGDTFTVTVLGQTITYEVDQIRIVLPEDLSDLGIEEGKDYCTLVTCTPYGVNTHRMLVRGHRIENLDDIGAVTADAIQIPRYIAIPAVTIPILFVFLMGLLISNMAKRPRMDKEQVLYVMRGQMREEVEANRPDEGL